MATLREVMLDEFDPDVQAAVLQQIAEAEQLQDNLEHIRALAGTSLRNRHLSLAITHLEDVVHRLRDFTSSR